MNDKWNFVRGISKTLFLLHAGNWSLHTIISDWRLLSTAYCDGVHVNCIVTDSGWKQAYIHVSGLFSVLTSIRSETRPYPCFWQFSFNIYWDKKHLIMHFTTASNITDINVYSFYTTQLQTCSLNAHSPHQHVHHIYLVFPSYACLSNYRCS